MDKRLEAILPRVQKPARYAGGEFNAVVKKAEDVRIRFAFCFPDSYEVGMSHLGSRILYGLMNEREDTWCERVYAPWPDMEREMREAGVPLYGLESGDPVSRFDIIGFTLQYELCYTNLLNMLDLAGIPLRARDREGLHNLVICGGPCVYNAEPVADFVDLMQIGEGEEVMGEMLDLYAEAKRAGWSKERFLTQAAKIEGVYVPAFYDVSYHEDGTVRAIAAKNGAPEKVTKRIVRDFDAAYFPDRFVVPSTGIVFDRAMVEMFRGCPRGCRFCQAGHTYRPLRAKKPETLARQARALIDSTGYEEISLSSLSTSDYTGLDALCDEMLAYCEPRHVSLSLPSLRADSFSTELMEKVQKVRKSGLTFAPEAGTQRLRDVINKNLTREDLLHACRIAFDGGWNAVKLYFMIGLPTETEEDLDGIAELARAVAYEWKQSKAERNRGVRVTVSASSFVPKPQTPFQWVSQDTVEALEKKQQYLKQILKTKNVTFNYHDAQTSFLEAVFARGDRRLGDVIEYAWRLGCKFDGWDEYLRMDLWYKAFADCGVDTAFYANRTRGMDELFPWDHIDCGSDKEHLKRELELARAAVTTPDCKTKCAGCGAAKLMKGERCHV